MPTKNVPSHSRKTKCVFYEAGPDARDAAQLAPDSGECLDKHTGNAIRTLCHHTGKACLALCRHTGAACRVLHQHTGTAHCLSSDIQFDNQMACFHHPVNIGDGEALYHVPGQMGEYPVWWGGWGGPKKYQMGKWVRKWYQMGSPVRGPEGPWDQLAAPKTSREQHRRHQQDVIELKLLFERNK